MSEYGYGLINIEQHLEKMVAAIKASNFGSACTIAEDVLAEWRENDLSVIIIDANMIKEHRQKVVEQTRRAAVNKYSVEYNEKLEAHRQKLQDCFDEKVEREVQNRLKAVGGGQKVEVDIEKCQ